jgi:hypothetical protein
MRRSRSPPRPEAILTVAAMLRQLPGGLPGDQGRRRSYAFRRADGALEMALADAVNEAGDTPDAVSRALLASLAELAGERPGRAAVDALCVADRQFLMRALAAHLGHQGGWFDATCMHCASPFDFRLDPAGLPVKEAGDAFPLARLVLDDKPLTLRVPCGADQIRVLREPVEQRREALLRGLEVPDPESGSALPDQLTQEHIAHCEAALEAQAPEITREVAACCPECGQVNSVGIDPYAVLAHNPAGLLAEVHRLAWHYHWSEADILALPRGRRKNYLALIDAARGMTG